MEPITPKPIQEGLFEMVDSQQGKLLINRCERCDLSFYPKRMVCISCHKEDKLVDDRLSENGRLYTYTVVHQSIPLFKVPYIIGYIDFEKSGIRVFGQIGDCRPEDLNIGDTLEIYFETMDTTDEHNKTLVCKFRPFKSTDTSQETTI